MCNVLAAIVTEPACDMLTPIKAEQESKKQSQHTCDAPAPSRTCETHQLMRNSQHVLHWLLAGQVWRVMHTLLEGHM